MPPSPEQVFADKATIDAAVLQLVKVTQQRVKLPPPNPASEVGPFSHLRAALKVLKRDLLVKRVASFEDSWLDLIVREQQRLPRPYPRTLADLVDDWGKQAIAQRKLLNNKGVVVLADPQGRSLVLAPPGGGASVYEVDARGVTLLGRSVAEFVEREVARLLGTPRPALTAAPTVDKAALREATARERALAKLRKSQPPSSTVHGALVVAWSVHDLKTTDDLLALEALAREHGLALFAGCGDVESTATDTDLWLAHWLVGVELAAVRGVTEKRSGFTFEAAALAKAAKQLDAIAVPLRKLCAGRASKPTRGTYVVARGGLPVVHLVKGVWVAPPAAVKRDASALGVWLTELPSSEDGVGYVHGTRVATQSPGPGAVHGVRVGGADACAEAVTWTAKQDKDLDRPLARAGIEGARYFLVTRFD